MKISTLKAGAPGIRFIGAMATFVALVLAYLGVASQVRWFPFDSIYFEISDQIESGNELNFFLDYKKGPPLQIEAIRLTISGQRGGNKWQRCEGGASALADGRIVAYGEKCYSMTAGEYGFQNRFDNIPMRFEVMEMKPGESRKFYFRFQMNAIEEYVPFRQDYGARLEVVSQGDVVWSKVIEYPEMCFWRSFIFMPRCFD